MSDDKKADRVIDELKHDIRVKALKTHTNVLEDGAIVALNIDSALRRSSDSQY